ncbi:MAG: DUF1302 domain-containing protein [Rhodocyclaceae bacterium]
MNDQSAGRDGARYLCAAVAAALGATCALLPAPASAFKFGNESVQGSFDSTISFGIQQRMSNRDCLIIGRDNGGCGPTSGPLGEIVNGPGFGATANPDFNMLQFDDGNLNYNKHDIVSAALKGSHELGLKWGQGWGALVRATWVKDFKADDTRRTPLSDSAKDDAVSSFTLLDAYVSKALDLGSRPAKFKLGNQVISWGEDIFIYGGINITNAIDFRKAHTPGMQLKEIFIPAQILSLNTGVTDNVSLEAYYQFKWNSFKFDPVGSYFSTADVVHKGQSPAFIPTSVLEAIGAIPPGSPPGTVGDVGSVAAAGNLPGIPPGSRFTLADLVGVGTVIGNLPDKSPKRGGQGGLALRWKPESGAGEFGFYYLRYHDKIPSLSFTPGATNYFLEYGEDRDLWGVSMNTSLGNWAVGAELSYRPRDSVFIDPTVPLAGRYACFAPGATLDNCRGYVEEKKWQAHLTGIYLLGPQDWGGLVRALGASEGIFLGELAVAHYPKLDRSGAIPYLLSNYEMPDKTSWGYVFELGITYPHAFLGINVTPQIDFSHWFSGTSPNAIPFVEGAKSLMLSLNFDYQSKWKGQLAYTGFWGGGQNNLLRDRDFLSMSVSYSF